MPTSSSIEPLESRIAPAVVISGHSASYTDIDGDHVTITVSKGTLAMGDFTTVTAGMGDQLESVILTGSDFDGANITFAVKKSATGDGLANVGEIDATGLNLGAVKLPGDLGRIVAGSGAAGTAIKSLAVDSLGRLGISTQATGGNLESDLDGSLGKFAVKHDVAQAFVNVTGSIGSVAIGNSILGGAANNSGFIQASGSIGGVTVGGDIQGGSASMISGGIDAGVSIKSVAVKGSILGGTGGGHYGGYIFAGTSLGSIKIGGDLVGSAQADSAEIATGGTLGSLSIGGSMRGGLGTASAFVLA